MSKDKHVSEDPNFQHDETIPGGRYHVAGQVVDSEGLPIGKKTKSSIKDEIDRLKAQLADAPDEEEENAWTDSSQASETALGKHTVADLKAMAAELEVPKIDELDTKAKLIDAILAKQAQ